MQEEDSAAFLWSKAAVRCEGPASLVNVGQMLQPRKIVDIEGLKSEIRAKLAGRWLCK